MSESLCPRRFDAHLGVKPASVKRLGLVVTLVGKPCKFAFQLQICKVHGRFAYCTMVMRLAQRIILGTSRQITIPSGWSFCPGTTSSLQLHSVAMRLQLLLAPEQKSGAIWGYLFLERPLP